MTREDVFEAIRILREEKGADEVELAVFFMNIDLNEVSVANCGAHLIRLARLYGEQGAV